MDTAAVMQHLDLVITSDTAIAHLAGALGVRAWVALAKAVRHRPGIVGVGALACFLNRPGRQQAAALEDNRLGKSQATHVPPGRQQFCNCLRKEREIACAKPRLTEGWRIDTMQVSIRPPRTLHYCNSTRHSGASG